MEFVRPEDRDLRKTVTIVFTDVTGSTGLGERLDPESFRRVMRRYFARMRLVLERHGGTVQKFIGDAILAVFGHPVAHEDDAVRAMRAAAEMREELSSLNDELEREWGLRIAARTGVNTGEVVLGDPAVDDSLLIGDAVNVAARLEQQADPDEILVGELTRRLGRHAVVAEPMPPVELRGRSEPVGAYRLISVQPVPDAAGRPAETPLVGRARERRALDEAFHGVIAGATPHLVTVLGEAGVGKSRLAAELITSCRLESQVLFGRCLPYGKGITFWPVLEVIREALALPDATASAETMNRLTAFLGNEEDAGRIAPRLGQLIGLTEIAAGVEETFWAVRRFLEMVARRRPAVVVIDDLHWAEPTLLDLIHHVADHGRGPLLLVCLTRPDLRDLRPVARRAATGDGRCLTPPPRCREWRRRHASLRGCLPASGGQGDRRRPTRWPRRASC
jgi:class 3 adenylate cyclase